jgi:glutamyl-tRNA reductase
VFARELEEMDDTSRQVLEKMLTYFEKKYISVPMKMAKEILLDKH